MSGHVFLSYVRENRKIVDRLKTALELRGISTWTDRHKLAPGQRWGNEIPNAIKSASFFVACFSAESESREHTEMNNELAIAVEELKRRQFGRDWLVPVRLSKCNIPEYPIGFGQTLADIHWLDLFLDWDGGIDILVAKLLAQPSQRQRLMSNGDTNQSRHIPNTRSTSRQVLGVMSNPPSPELQSPGGPVSATAVSYLEREHDAVILDTLRMPSFTLLVAGPVQSGKSTALGLLERKAHELGIETAWFDPRPQSTLPTVGQEADTEADATRMVSELLQARWDLQHPKRGVIDTIPKLNHWLIEELAPTAYKRRLLILDDLVALGAAAAERWLTVFVRALVNQRATRDIHISVAVGLTDSFGVNFRRRLILVSSAIHWQPKLVVGWLNLHEVQTLSRSVQVSHDAAENSQATSDEIFATFKGQPYLTHAAVIDRLFLKIVQEWSRDHVSAKANAIRRSTWYRKHLGAIRLAILGPTYEPNPEARRLVRSFAEACATVQSSIDPDHLLFLETAQLLDAGGQPTLKIYRLIAEDLLGAC